MAPREPSSRLARHAEAADARRRRRCWRSGRGDRGAARLPAGHRSRRSGRARRAAAACAPIAGPAKRGDILDRRGRVLATSVDADSIYAVPSEIDDATATVAAAVRRARRLHRKRAPGSDRAAAASSALRLRAPAGLAGEARRVAALNLDGIGFVKESRRFYPNKELAAHLLGYVGLDNTGLGGIESAYDSRFAARTARSSSRPTPRATRSAGSSGRRPPARPSS